MLEQFVEMNVDSDEWNEPTATLCPDCYTEVGKGVGGKGKIPKRPKLSVANGVDFGQPERIGLPRGGDSGEKRA